MIVSTRVIKQPRTKLHASVKRSTTRSVRSNQRPTSVGRDQKRVAAAAAAAAAAGLSPAVLAVVTICCTAMPKCISKRKK